MSKLKKLFNVLRSERPQRHDELGREILDETPMALPIGFQRPPTLQEQVARLVRTEFSRQAVAEGRESFEEADDFDMDDVDFSSPYEEDYDLATVQAANKGFIEERPITSERKTELLSKYVHKRSKKGATDSKEGDEPSGSPNSKEGS
ncbi:MAG: hypothetical protein [Arizlama microvirus]|nr:MAG: hypothetical protein [Arizlama microvirus]